MSKSQTLWTERNMIPLDARIESLKKQKLNGKSNYNTMKWTGKLFGFMDLIYSSTTYVTVIVYTMQCLLNIPFISLDI